MISRCTWIFCAMVLANAVFAAAPITNERVLDTFNVGENVYVRALNVEPKTNTLWVGTSSGVNEVELNSGKLRNTYTRDHGLASEHVFAIGIDPQGNKWFGTNAGGASRFRDGKWRTYFPMHGLADYWVYAFANHPDGSLWIGTWAGASRFEPKTGKFRNYSKELVNVLVYGIAVDTQRRLWFGTEGGVSMYDGKNWKAWTHKEGLGAGNAESLPQSDNAGLGTKLRHDLNVQARGRETHNPNYVFAIHVAADGAVWAGTWGGGAARFDGNKWRNYTRKDGLAGNLVYSIAEDALGALWFGTDRGISKFDGQTWRTIGRRDGLLEEHVYALAAAPGGNIWAGTRRGATRIGR